ncbi:MAG: hypothetical protein IPL13_13755 [Saprospiraceae bacterium]|nr:hypothetical protein [Candidatus Brachybacter algidus]
MRNIIIIIIRNFFGLFGILLIRATKKDDLVSFIKKLSPLKTNLELIRLGPNGDGGYLVPDDLENIEACFSPGVDKISEFEKACSLLEMKIFMADKSVDNPILDIEKYRYKFLKNTLE